jgi:hypothetical protein
LSVEPSSDLSARVRARVDRHGRVALAGSWTLGVAFTVLVAVLALTVSQDQPRERGTPVRPVAIAAAESGAPGTQARSRPAAVVAAPVAPDRLTRTPRRSVGASTTVAELVSGEPELIVPADQGIALQRILAAMRSGRSPVPPATVVAVDANGRLPAPPYIDIPEITIERLLPLPNGGGSRER